MTSNCACATHIYFAITAIRTALDRSTSRPYARLKRGKHAARSGPLSFAVSFEKTLHDQLPFLGVPTISRAAEISGISPRTLQRQLGSDGLTYQRLIDRIRFQMARKRLRRICESKAVYMLRRLSICLRSLAFSALLSLNSP